MHLATCYKCRSFVQQGKPEKRCDYCVSHYPLAVVTTNRCPGPSYIALFGPNLPSLHAFGDKEFLQGCPGVPLALVDLTIERFVSSPSLTAMGIRPIDPWSAACMDETGSWTLAMYQLGIYRHVRRCTNDVAEVYRLLSPMVGRTIAEISELMHASTPLIPYDACVFIVTETLENLETLGLARKLASNIDMGDVPNHMVDPRVSNAIGDVLEEDSLDEAYFRWLPIIVTCYMGQLLKRVKSFGETTSVAEVEKILPQILGAEAYDLFVNRRAIFYQRCIVDKFCAWINNPRSTLALDLDSARVLAGEFIDDFVSAAPSMAAPRSPNLITPPPAPHKASSKRPMGRAFDESDQRATQPFQKRRRMAITSGGSRQYTIGQDGSIKINLRTDADQEKD